MFVSYDHGHAEFCPEAMERGRVTSSNESHKGRISARRTRLSKENRGEASMLYRMTDSLPLQGDDIKLSNCGLNRLDNLPINEYVIRDDLPGQCLETHNRRRYRNIEKSNDRACDQGYRQRQMSPCADIET
jgi:hypothetical protein